MNDYGYPEVWWHRLLDGLTVEEIATLLGVLRPAL